MLLGVTLGVTGFALATQLDPARRTRTSSRALLLFAIGNGLSSRAAHAGRPGIRPRTPAPPPPHPSSPSSSDAGRSDPRDGLRALQPQGRHGPGRLGPRRGAAGLHRGCVARVRSRRVPARRTGAGRRWRPRTRHRAGAGCFGAGTLDRTAQHSSGPAGHGQPDLDLVRPRASQVRRPSRTDIPAILGEQRRPTRSCRSAPTGSSPSRRSRSSTRPGAAGSTSSAPSRVVGRRSPPVPDVTGEVEVHPRRLGSDPDVQLRIEEWRGPPVRAPRPGPC